MNAISLVVPTLNEEGNIKRLIERSHAAFYSKNLIYEIIFVDDNSTDQTVPIILSLIDQYPISLIIKDKQFDNPGKAHSLLKGFKSAKYELIGMIDADLQYAPESIPQMIEKIDNGADIVVANRHEKNLSVKRKIMSKTFKTAFGKLLHNMDFDVQSGLKIFKKEILESVTLNPTPWTFDLEFLVKARNAGFKIDSIEIDFEERTAGDSKVKALKASYEIGIGAVRLKTKPLEVVPLAEEKETTIGKGFIHKGKQFVHHSLLAENEMAFFRLSNGQLNLMIIFAISFLILFILSWYWTLLIILVFLSVLYFSDIFFNLYLIIRSFSKSPEIKISQQEINQLPDSFWPTYTIFCPLYKEWQVVPQFVQAMQKLDYPQNKLQVMLLLEEDDTESVEKIKQFELPSSFEVVVVPHSMPKTKPKACNYGLTKATGEYSVIYDAEDVPETDQLKKAVLAFQKADNKTACVQAKLNFYNPHHNILTRLFTAEYSLWFDLVLPGLQSIGAAIPLGGTSNHFKTKDLFTLKGWDAFNVTEDCDLGLRLAKKGYTTAIVDSTTHEEANSDLPNWIGQRSRWIKGYIQSYFVHMRDLRSFSGNSLHFVFFQLVVGGKILSMFINPIFWILTLSYFLFRPWIGESIESFFPGPILYLGVFSAVVGNFLYFYYYMIGCVKREYYELVKFGFLIPFYWLMMSYAAWIAVYKIITQPHYWYKTKHGLHLKNVVDKESLSPKSPKVELSLPTPLSQVALD